ncbi:MAG: ribosomal RNA small subunit methyltransferase A [Candidatus Latescibacteria bacterium]|nr:ribosomal RNA small subunit methyltransferase A [Candidatus Latescibacterota bacterium]
MYERGRTHRPRKRFGQHFLTDGRIADRIVGSAGIGPDDVVLEIGPGKGILTGRLIERAREVVAVEIDRDLAGALEVRFGGKGSFRLIAGDILTVDIGGIAGKYERRIVVVSNIPYNISAPIVELLAANHRYLSRAVIMLQREVAQRLLAEPGSRDYGLTTLNLALYAVGRNVMDVMPGSFHPAPGVVSRVIALELAETCRYPLDDEAVFRRLTGAAFRQRRKMVRNTLLPFMAASGVSAGRASLLLESAGIDPTVRPERITVDSFVRLSNGLAGEHSARPTESDE